MLLKKFKFKSDSGIIIKANACDDLQKFVYFKGEGVYVILHILAFEIRLSNRQLPRLFPREICIFSNVRQQIIAKAELSYQHLC